jgi:DnaJ-class molecular chaperone with C-terminal Zn finger domain|tara:strand:- start:263 stop:793 length:531 start_codon:yes stop_codon:yes gene_type:complete
VVFSLNQKYMNIIIYTVVILTIFYFLLRLITNISSRKISKGLRFLIILGLIALAVLFAIGGKFLLTLPLTLASLALLKLKGLSIFQLISLFRLIQTLRRSGRFSFNQAGTNNVSSISVSEAYKILNLDMNKKVTKEDVNKAYIKIQKKIHPDISPETSRLSSIVNEAKDIVLNDIS